MLDSCEIFSITDDLAATWTSKPPDNDVFDRAETRRDDHPGEGDRTMRRLIIGVLVVGGLVATLSGLTAAQSATGTLRLTDGSIAADIGFSWGKGTLTYNGKTYPVKRLLTSNCAPHRHTGS